MATCFSQESFFDIPRYSYLIAILDLLRDHFLASYTQSTNTVLVSVSAKNNPQSYTSGRPYYRVQKDWIRAVEPLRRNRPVPILLQLILPRMESLTAVVRVVAVSRTRVPRTLLWQLCTSFYFYCGESKRLFLVVGSSSHQGKGSAAHSSRNFFK